MEIQTSAASLEAALNVSHCAQYLPYAAMLSATPVQLYLFSASNGWTIAIPCTATCIIHYSTYIITLCPNKTPCALTTLGHLQQERLAAMEKSTEDLSQLHRKEVSRLEAALAGAEAAKQQLSSQQAQHSTAGESDLQAANAAQAEADARASSLQRQIDTLRAQAAASRSGLQDEASSLKVACLAAV